MNSSPEVSITRDERGVIRAPHVLLTDRAGHAKTIPGNDLFPRVFDENVFVDKSLLIRDVLEGAQATLYCRPRRFGKTLAATMLQNFFECTPCGDPKARERFELLSIWDADDGRWREHQGAYPVIMLSLKGVEGQTWEETREQLGVRMAQECGRHGYLLDSPDVAPFDRAMLTRIASGTASTVDLMNSLQALTRALCQHHGVPCMVVIDEYDAPITKAAERGYYDQAVAFMRSWLTDALKTNPSLARGVLTGVQRISKESIFSGLNNIKVSTALNQTSDERFGLTQHEVEALAAYLNHSDTFAEIQAWYDGYRFGSAHIYNPWSVLSYFDEGCVAQPYWAGTSGNAVLNQALRGSDTDAADELLSLLEPDTTVTHPIDPGIAYSELGRAGTAWSILYMSGYLTTDDTELPRDPLHPRKLRVPNVEVRGIFRREVIERARATAGGIARLAPLHRALTTGDAEGFEAELAAILLKSASFHDLTSEAACHTLLMGLLFGVDGYGDPLSNREAGFGRFDLQLQPCEPGRPLLTVEVKAMRPDVYRELGDAAPERLRALAEQALAQIGERAYDEVDPAALDDAGTAPPLRWGVAFAGKHVAVACSSKKWVLSALPSNGIGSRQSVGGHTVPRMQGEAGRSV